MAGSTERGFSLVETTIVVAIFGLIAAIAVPTISNITRAELRGASSKLAGLVRRTYDDAALSGQTHRLVFDLSSRTIRAEATQQVLAFEPDSNVLAEAGKARQEIASYREVPAELASLLTPATGEDKGDEVAAPMSAIGAMFGMGALGGSGGLSTDGQAFAAGGDALVLPEGVKLMDVWIQGMSEPSREGVVYLHFFPHGFTQDALIHLTDDSSAGVFTVKVAALTGKTRIVPEYLEAPK